MSERGIRVNEGATGGPMIDTDQLLRGDGAIVQRQRIEVTGTEAAAVADVTNVAPAASAYGLAVRVVGQPPKGLNTYGSTVNITVGMTDLLVSLVAPAGYSLRGFTATGDGDGYFIIKIAGVPVLSGRTTVAMKSISITNDPAPVTAGALITVHVTNKADGTCGYEGTILGVQSV